MNPPRIQLNRVISSALCAWITSFALQADAGLLQIDFTASGGSSQAFGQFVVDTSNPLVVNSGFQYGFIQSAWFEVDGLTGVADLDSGFTFATATQNSSNSSISLYGDYGPQIFGLQFENADWFPSSNAFDVLVPGLSLTDLDPFGDQDPIATSFFYFENVPFVTNFLELTSLSVKDVSAIAEPESIWLILGGFASLILAIQYGQRARKGPVSRSCRVLEGVST